MRKYSTASSIISAGVCSMLIIQLEPKNPKIPRNMLKSKKLINEVDMIVFILP